MEMYLFLILLVTNIPDQIRLKREYENRKKRLAGSDIYSVFNSAYLFTIHNRQRAVLDALRRSDYRSLDGLRILEVGVGYGGVLQEFTGLGVTPTCLHGTELIFDRVKTAKDHLSFLQLTCADGQNLPYASKSFDLVLQYTVFSSILDPSIKAAIAHEMLRVLSGVNGLILWYDFWLNPTNPQTRGVMPNEIRELFPGCRFEFKRITLAPPIARKLVRISWNLANLLEKSWFLNTHYFAAIQPKSV